MSMQAVGEKPLARDVRMREGHHGAEGQGVRTMPTQSQTESTTKNARAVVISDQWAHLIAGGTGGVATAILTSPLDVLRTRLQSDFYRAQLQQHAPPATAASRLALSSTIIRHFRETFDILFSIHRVEGWRSLFKGLGPSMTGVVPATAIKFYAYGNCKRLLPDALGVAKDATIVHVLSAATAGIATGTATNPIWLVKTRLQLDKSRVRHAQGEGGAAAGAGAVAQRQYRNSWDCVRQVIKHEGVKGLYRGLMASYLGVIETTLHLTAYEHLKGILTTTPSTVNAAARSDAVEQKQQGETEEEGEFQGFALGAAAAGSKLLAVLIAYPHEVIRTRLRQAPLADGRQKYTGVLQCMRLMIREEGLATLYGGLTAHLMRTVPSAAITLGTYELVLRLLGAT